MRNAYDKLQGTQTENRIADAARKQQAEAVLEYLSGMAAELAAMADDSGNGFLAGIFAAAAIEAGGKISRLN